jgi:hypothetical protein
MYEALAMTLTIDKLTDFFSAVDPRVAETQPRIIELTAYAPLANRKQAMYRAGVLRVTQEMMYPTSAIPIQAVICQVRSLNRPEDHPARYPKKPDTR